MCACTHVQMYIGGRARRGIPALWRPGPGARTHINHNTNYNTNNISNTTDDNDNNMYDDNNNNVHIDTNSNNINSKSSEQQ